MIENNNSLSYSDRYINHANTSETQDRSRRLTSFESAGELKEILNKESLKHIELCKIVKTKSNGNLDHISFWELGTMAVVMTETYRSKLEDYECDELYVREIPRNIAPYCGSFEDTLGAVPGTKSFLITSRLKKSQLDKVINRLIERSKKLPAWNYIGVCENELI